MIKEFIKRNTPVFVIGLITLGIFVLIILLAQNNPTAGPGLKEIKNETLVTGTTQTKGNPQAKVVLVEFSDFECPACKATQPDIDALVTKYQNYIFYAFKNFPLPQHTLARAAAIAAQAAGKQAKFWAYADTLFANQPDFSQDELAGYASDLGLDMAKFKADIADPVVAQEVDDDAAQALRIGLNGTPSFILDNRLVEFTGKDAFEKILVAEFQKNGVTTTAQTNESTQTAKTSTEDTQNTLAANEPQTNDNTPTPDTNGVIQINYTPKGFNPNNVKAAVGQTIRFKNTTDADMKLMQVIELYSQLTEPVTLSAGKTFDLTITQNKLWTFKEANHMHYGSITVSSN